MTVTVFLLITFAAFLFENDNLFTFEVFQHGCFNHTAGYVGSTYFYFTFVVDQQNFFKIERSSYFSIQTVNKDFSPFFNFKLLSCNIYNCVHNKCFKKF